MTKKTNYSRYIARSTAAAYASDPKKRSHRDYIMSRHAARCKMLERLMREDRDTALRLAVDTPENMRELDALIAQIGPIGWAAGS